MSVIADNLMNLFPFLKQIKDVLIIEYPFQLHLILSNFTLEMLSVMVDVCL